MVTRNHRALFIHAGVHICKSLKTGDVRDSNMHNYCTEVLINLWAPCVLYRAQAFRCSPENAFYIFNQQIRIFHYLRFA
jgi:hypothetical protein